VLEDFEDRSVLVQELRDKIKALTSGSQYDESSLLEKVFSEIDVDGSGEISPSEFEQMLRKMEMCYSGKKFLRLYNAIDRNDDGSLSIDELNHILFPEAAKAKEMEHHAKILGQMADRRLSTLECEINSTSPSHHQHNLKREEIIKSYKSLKTASFAIAATHHSTKGKNSSRPENITQSSAIHQTSAELFGGSNQEEEEDETGKGRDYGHKKIPEEEDGEEEDGEEEEEGEGEEGEDGYARSNPNNVTGFVVETTGRPIHSDMNSKLDVKLTDSHPISEVRGFEKHIAVGSHTGLSLSSDGLHPGGCERDPLSIEPEQFASSSRRVKLQPISMTSAVVAKRSVSVSVSVARVGEREMAPFSNATHEANSTDKLSSNQLSSPFIGRENGFLGTSPILRSFTSPLLFPPTLQQTYSRSVIDTADVSGSPRDVSCLAQLQQVKQEGRQYVLRTQLSPSSAAMSVNPGGGVMDYGSGGGLGGNSTDDCVDGRDSGDGNALENELPYADYQEYANLPPHENLWGDSH
jgi:Ca2+-binding EF-hand superfamily protein